MLADDTEFDTYEEFVHTDWHTSGGLANGSGGLRANFYSFTGVPYVVFDGQNGVTGAGDSVSAYNQYRPRALADKAALSRVILTAEVDFNCATGIGTYNVDVEIAAGETVANPELASVRVAISESNIILPQEPHTGNIRWHDISRLMATEVTLTAGNSGDTQNVSGTFALNPSWDTQELKAVAFVQRNNTRKVLQAAHAATMYDVNVVNLDPLMASVIGATVTRDTEVSYAGVVSDDVIITLDDSGLPAGWTAELVHGATTSSTSITIIGMTNGQTEDVSVNITPDGTTPGFASVEVTCAPASNSCAGESSTYSVFNNTPAILVVNDDNGEDLGANEALQAGVAAAGQFSVLHHISTHGNPVPEDLAGYDAIIWSTGSLQGKTIGLTRQGYLMDVMDTGTNVALFSHGFLNHQGIKPFTEDYMGVQAFLQDQQALTVTGVAGDIGDGIAFSTSGPFADFSDTQTPSPGAVGWLEGHLGNTVAMRYDGGAFKSVFSSVAFELMTPPAGDDVMTAVLNWFFPSGGTGVTTSEGRLSLALAQNAPNPFRNGTSVGFALPQDGRVKLTVFNVAGQKVVDLANRSFPAGNHQVSWDGRDAQGHAVASGVYLYRLEAAGASLTREMVRLK